MATSVCGILRRGNLVLIARRSPRGSIGGKWEFPGGKVEAEENPAKALVREFREELSLDIEVLDLMAETTFVHQGKQIRLLAYEVRSQGEPVVGEEHSEVRWILPKDFHLFDFPDSDRGLIQLLFS